MQQILNENGLEKIHGELAYLLQMDLPVTDRYTRFSERVARLGGPASLTEMLACLHPDRCAIWNRRARDALRELGFSSVVNPNKYRITAQEYEKFNDVAAAIAEQLRSAGFADADPLFVDYFLWRIAGEGEPPVDTDWDHDEVRDLLVRIGTGLGFEPEPEVKVAHGAVVDCVWTARIANLGIVRYCFEVHRSGSIDSLLLNLQKAKGSPAVQRVVAVSDETQLEKIRLEAERLPEEFRKALAFWPVKQVLQVDEHLAAAMEVINGLGLAQAES